MKRAKISEAKNGLSALIARVRRGESVLIMDRETPVARLEPVDAATLANLGGLGAIGRSGIVDPPRRPLDVAAFLGRKMPRLTPGASAVRTLLSERENGR